MGTLGLTMIFDESTTPTMPRDFMYSNRDKQDDEDSRLTEQAYRQAGKRGTI